MRIFLLSFLFIATSYLINAQVVLEKKDFDLGEVQLLNDDVIDLNLKNNTEQSLFIIRIESEDNVQVKFTSRTIDAGEAQLLRLKLNPREVGIFETEVKLFFGQNKEALLLNFKAEVLEIPVNHLQSCPDFSNNSRIYASAGEFKKQAKGEIQSEFVGVFEEDELREYLAEQKKEQRQQEENLRRQRQEEERLQRELLRKQRMEEILAEEAKREELSREEKEDELEIVELQESEVEEKEEELEIEILEDYQEEAELGSTEEVNSNLLDNTYKPNNIVFLLDVSTSMQHDGKIELLKAAMKELLIPLREIDYLAIVSYAGESSVILPSTPASQKSLIAARIDELNADGSTNAVKGINRALQVASANFIEGGNNQIILATDGAFDIGSKNNRLRSKIERYAKDDIHISVIGIKNDKWTNKSLKEISDLGSGKLLKLRSENNLNVILDEVKYNSKTEL